MRVTSKGQVTIPVEIREKAGLLPHTESSTTPGSAPSPDNGCSRSSSGMGSA